MTCPICDEKKDIIYEDDTLFVRHVAESSKGHLAVIPRAHVTRVEGIPDALMTHLFFTANYASAILFELLGAQGTNIIMTEDGGHLVIHVIERVQDDGLSFLWKPLRLQNDEMERIAAKVKDKVVIGKEKKGEVIVIDTPIAKDTAASPEISGEGEGDQANGVNYLLRQLDRIP